MRFFARRSTQSGLLLLVAVMLSILLALQMWAATDIETTGVVMQSGSILDMLQSMCPTEVT